MSALLVDLLRLPAREREAIANSFQNVADVLRGDLPGGAVRADDELLAPDLLRFWWLEFGPRALTVAEMFNAHPETKLGRLLAELVDDSAGNENQAKRKLGHMLRRLQCSRREFAGYAVRSHGVTCGVQTWECIPSEPP